MHKIALRNLHEAAANRPSGYIDDVLTHGVIVNSHVELSDDAYEKLIAKYQKKEEEIVQGLKAPLQSPGNILAIIIRQITGKNSKACMACSKRVQQMNVWGWWKCWEKREIILGWLCEEVEKLGHPVDRNVIFSLLKAAVMEAIKARAKRLLGNRQLDGGDADVGDISRTTCNGC